MTQGYKHSISSLLLLVLLSVLPLPASAQWNNEVINFPKEVYGGNAQVWQIRTYGEGNWIYFANKNGLIQYDGSRWETFTIHNKLDIRSIYCSQREGHIYMGGIHEFGFLHPDERGQLQYTCLSDSLPPTGQNLGNVWNIFESDGTLYFQGDHCIIRSVNGLLTAIPSDEKIDCAALINHILYIGTPNGVKILTGNRFSPIHNGSNLEKERIRGFIPHEEGVLIATAVNGLFYYDGRQATPYKIGIEDFMRDNELFTIHASPSKIAIGTVHKGLAVIDKETQAISYFNEYNGLQNNTVLSLLFDPKGNLWAGLNDGIDYICLDSPFSNLYAHPNSLGAGNCCILAGNKFYFGTNRGLYVTNYPIAMTGNPLQAEFIANTSGQVWGLRKAKEDLFCMHDRGLFLIRDNKVERIGEVTGVWDFRPLTPAMDKLLLGTYEGFYIVQKDHRTGRWDITTRLEGYTESAENFEVENGHVIWTHYHRKNVLRIELDTVSYKINSIKQYNREHGFPAESRHYINSINEKIYLHSNEQIYRYDAFKDSIVKDDMLMSLFENRSTNLRIFNPRPNSYIAINEQRLSLVANTDSTSKTISYSLERYAIDVLKNFKNLSMPEDSLVVVPNANGFALINLNKQEDVKQNNRIHITHVYVTYPKDSIIYTDNFCGNKYVPHLSYGQRSIKFTYAPFSFTKDQEATFRYRLEPLGDWREASASQQIKEYGNLPEGKYTFHIEATFQDGSLSRDEFSFVIRPPWYRTVWAYLCYGLLVLLLLWGIYKWDDARLIKKKEYAIQEKEKEMAAIEQLYKEENARKERQIMELEHEKLEYKLKYKSQEIADLMINFQRKNDILSGIRKELLGIIGNIKGDQQQAIKKMLLILNSKIDSNIQSDETLKRIEEEFDLVHNSFIKRLTTRHPDLSLNEKMMCTYLKMGLSTKEIAPLLNLSTRGVETIRYRLRKKFDLEREESLTDYLNSII